MNNDNISATGLLGNALSAFKLALVVVGNALIVTDWLHDFWAFLETFLENVLDSVLLRASTFINNDKILAAQLVHNTLSAFKQAFVFVSNALVITNRRIDLSAIPATFDEGLHKSVVLIQTDAFMDNDKIPASGLLCNALSAFKLALVVVSNAFIITDWRHGFWALLDTFFENILDSVLVQTNSFMDNSDISTACFLGNALSDLKFANVVVSDAFAVANRHDYFRAFLQAFFQNVLDAILLGLSVDGTAADQNGKDENWRHRDAELVN